MTLFAIIGGIIILCFCLQWLALPVAIFQLRALTYRWIWVLGVLALPLSYIAALQSGQLRSPSWTGWVARLLIAGAVAFGILQLGASSLANSDAVFELKGTLMSLFTSEISSVEGRTIHTFEGGKVEIVSQAFPSSFAVASLAIIAGAMQFYGPITKSISLALVSFICSFITSVITEAWLVDGFSTNQSGVALNLLHDFRVFYNFHLWYLMTFCAAILWARYDIQNELLIDEASYQQENTAEATGRNLQP